MGGGVPEYPRDPVAHRRFREVAAAVLHALGATAGGPQVALRTPLPDTSPAGLAERERTLVEALEVLDAIDDVGLDVGDAVDLEVLRSDVARRLWQVAELRPAAWDARVHVPDAALRAVLHADADADERAAALLERLAELPDALQSSRDSLERATVLHAHAARDRIGGLRADLAGPAVAGLLARRAAPPAGAAAVLARADAALEAHAGWLGSLVAPPRRAGAPDPRLGPQRYAAQLWYCLDAELDPQALLTRAESDLMEREEELAEAAAAYLGRPPAAGRVEEALAAVAAEHAVPAAQRAAAVRAEWDRLLQRARQEDWAELPADVAAAVPEDLLAAAGPEGTGWDVARWDVARWDVAGEEVPPDRASLRTALASRGVPGALLLRARLREGAARSPVRAALPSACAAAGWGEHAADLVAEGTTASAPGSEEASLAAAVRLVRRLQRARSAVDAVVDVRVHCDGAGPEDVADLLVHRAHRSRERAHARWRACALDSAVLPVVHVGREQVAQVLRELERARPAWSPRQRHEALLREGAPPPRHLPALLDLPPDPPRDAAR